MFFSKDDFEYSAMKDDFVREIASELTEQDQRNLLGILQQLGSDGLASWLTDNAPIVVVFLGETKIGRKRNRIPEDSTSAFYAQQLLCAYGAMLFSQMAGYLGPQLNQTDFEGYARRSEERSNLAELAWAARQIQVDDWPVPPLMSKETLTDSAG